MFSNSVLYNYYNKFANCVNAKFSSCGKVLLLHVHGVFTNYMLLVNLIGTVSAKIAPRLKCYKNASRLNRYNFPTDNALDFVFSILHTTPFIYEVLKIGSR